VKPWLLCLQTRKESHGIMVGKMWGVGDLLLRNERKWDGFEGKTMIGTSTTIEENTIKTCNLVTIAHR
jgi:hypothetical protein